MSSIKKNAAWNLARTISGLAFPLISFPYTSRILGPDGIGRINFATSFTAYFVILAAVGIPLYGIREIARVRDDSAKLATAAKELFLIHLVNTSVVVALFLALVLSVPQLNRDLSLFLINSGLLLAALFSIEWVYQGLEDYAYITKRTVLVGAATIGSIFLFVRNHEDYLIAAGITVCASFANAAFNFARAGRILFAPKTEPLRWSRHIRPLATIFALNFVVSVYVNLDVVMLGFLSDTASTGYYSTGLRLTKMILGIVTSMSAVFLPRLSNLVQNGKEEQFEVLVGKSFAMVIFLCLPASLGLAILSKEIVLVMAGPKFLAAAACVVVTSPIILLIGLTGVTGTQVLYPRGKERLVLLAATAAAVVSIGLNWILIPRMGAVGAAIACLCAEIVDFGLEAFFLWKFCPVRFPTGSAIKFILSGAVMSCFLLGLGGFVGSPVFRLVLFPPLGAVVYIGSTMLLREQFVSFSISTLLERFGLKPSRNIHKDHGDGHVG